MIKRIFNFIFYRFYYSQIIDIIKNEKLKPTVIGNQNNLHIDNSVIIKDNVTFECNKGSINIGENSIILQDVKILSYGGSIKIGKNVSVNPLCILYGHGDLTIGDNVRIAANTIIIPSNHNFSNKDIPIYKQGETSKGIVIKDDVWIGTNVKILDDVSIERGIVIGAGSVVTKSLHKEYGVYAGVPAKFIKYRNE